jgi:hypothetical protein
MVATGNVSGGNLQISSAASIGGGVTVTGLVSASGNVVGGNLRTAGLVSATGSITAGSFTTAGNVVGGNITTVGLISATANIVTDGYFVGNLIGNVVANIVVPGSNTWVLYNNNGNAGASANLTFDSSTNSLGTQNIYADYFYGDGGNLTGVVATVIGTVPSLSVTGNIDTGNLRTAGLVSAAGNIRGGNINTSGAVSTTGEVTAANVNSFGFYGNSVEVESHVWVGNTGNSVWTAGNITGNNVISNTVVSSGIISATGNINTPADINSNTVSSFGFYGNSVEVEDHVWIGGTGNAVWTSGNVTGNNVITTGLMIVHQLASDPPGVTGAIYFNTGNSKFRGYDGTTWQNLN